jgi:hypothetical protein
LTKEKKSNLGFVPVLNTISEEDVEIKETGTNQFDGDLDGDGDDIEMGNEESDSNREVKAPLEMQKNRVSQILKKVDFVIQKITSSAALRQSEFAVWSTKLEHNGPSLIAGYGIQWKIQWQSQDRAYQACKVITKLINNKKDQQEREGGKNFYQEHEICRSD